MYSDKKMVFHLFNFVDLIGNRGSTISKEEVTESIQHVDLYFDKWVVEIKSFFSTRENFKALKNEGGYRLTHIGCFEKKDGTSFSGEEADEFLMALRFFLSFAKGGRCEPVCAVGFDTDETKVRELWSYPGGSWKIPSTWYDPHDSSQLIALFPRFMELWSEKSWRKALQEVIYWYLNANESSRGIDAGIILSQAALERLSYEFSVREKKLLTGKGFKDLWASDKFRLMFSSLNIPLMVSSETFDLYSMIRERGLLDAPHALTDIRNSLVHPEHKHRGQYENVYFDAWNLGLWYLEMSILAICGYSGNYGNRLKERWVGEVEKVPWV
jgi:hypothetical protein